MNKIQRALQSRISIRRNYIGAIEREIVNLRHQASVWGDNGFKVMARNLREEAKFLARDQRLDKDLFVMVLESAAAEREMQFFMDAVAAEADKGLFGINWNFFGAHAHG